MRENKELITAIKGFTYKLLAARKAFKKGINVPMIITGWEIVMCTEYTHIDTRTHTELS